LKKLFLYRAAAGLAAAAARPAIKFMEKKYVKPTRRIGVRAKVGATDMGCHPAERLC
jgi:hypothetical protein